MKLILINKYVCNGIKISTNVDAKGDLVIILKWEKITMAVYGKPREKFEDMEMINGLVEDFVEMIEEMEN